jgi:adenylylsulfate kinase
MPPYGHLVFHNSKVTLALRAHLNGHRPVNLWFTRLSGSVKFTLSYSVKERLHAMWCRTFVLDGGNVLRGLCGALGFSLEDRAENIAGSLKWPRAFPGGRSDRPHCL